MPPPFPGIGSPPPTAEGWRHPPDHESDTADQDARLDWCNTPNLERFQIAKLNTDRLARGSMLESSESTNPKQRDHHFVLGLLHYLTDNGGNPGNDDVSGGILTRHP